MSYDMAGAESGNLERELALRLLASRALADEDFYERLRSDPRAAAASVRIQLTDDDVRLIENVDWTAIEGPVQDLRRGLGLAGPRAAW